ncbi:Cytochrome P [Parasponia andersonii]|uniref:Cytochrome P n=1 Tax=Parasponia andersonii TaxID=3476 RepID=A0A2P5E2J0_PARAD|nr:Cytochrome P [Parasponia andersonii]
MKYFPDFSLISIVGATCMTLIPAMITSVETMLEGWKNHEGKEIEVFQDLGGYSAEAHHDPNEKHRILVEDVVDECKTFYFSGQETTNSLLAWTIFLLSIHTDWQEESRKEVLKLFRKQNPNPDGIAKLKTVRKVTISLSHYGLACISRKTEREVRLGNLSLPANTNLWTSSTALHHEPEIWGEDVNQFKPERFSEGVAKATRDNISAFLEMANNNADIVDAENMASSQQPAVASAVTVPIPAVA